MATVAKTVDVVARYNGAYAKRQVGFEFWFGSGDADAEADLAMATNGTKTHTHTHAHTLQFVVTSYTFLHIRAAL